MSLISASGAVTPFLILSGQPYALLPSAPLRPWPPRRGPYGHGSEKYASDPLDQSPGGGWNRSEDTDASITVVSISASPSLVWIRKLPTQVFPTYQTLGATRNGSMATFAGHGPGIIYSIHWRYLYFFTHDRYHSFLFPAGSASRTLRSLYFTPVQEPRRSELRWY